MFQNKIGPEQVPDVVKQVFQAHKVMGEIFKKVFIQLRDPTITNLSLSEFRALVDSWEEQVKNAGQSSPLGWK